MISILVYVLYVHLLHCVCFQEFQRLADRLMLKDVKDNEHFIHLIRCNMPVLTNVIPSNIMTYLLSKGVIRSASFMVVLFVILHFAASTVRGKLCTAEL